MPQATMCKCCVASVESPSHRMLPTRVLRVWPVLPILLVALAPKLPCINVGVVNDGTRRLENGWHANWRAES